MGKCKKNVRGFAYGGFLDSVQDATGSSIGTSPYANGAGTTTGISGAVHMTSTDASAVDPVAGQQASSSRAVNPATQSRRDSSPLGRLDQDIAMGNALGELSNTERYQMSNPGNQPYTIGQPQGRVRGAQPPMISAAPGSSAEASMRNQQTSIMSSLRDKLAAQPLYAGYSNGGIIGKLREAITGEKSQEPPPKTNNTIGISGYSDDNPQPAFANGGKIKGPGTPTSDSIQAEVKETGEPIAVSTGERIVSKEQDALLQKIAAGMGYDSLDAMLEAGTGKPVGPTIKGGMKHAAGGSPSIAELEAKRAPWLKGFADTIGGGIDTVENVAKALTGHGEEAQGVINESNKDIDRVNSVGAKLHNAAKGIVATIPAIAVDAYRAVKPAVAPLITGEDETQPKQDPTPSPSTTPSAPAAQTPVSNIDASNIPNSAGGNHGAEMRFTANEQQIAMPSGAIQGKSSVDATKLAAPDGGGYITNGAGKAMKIEANDGAWEDTKQYKDAIAQNAKDKELLAQMQRDRLMRDMGADITSQGTRIAAQQQLAQMDKDQAMQLLAQRGQREDAMSGLDQQLKGQQIAQLADNNALQKKVMAGDAAAIEMWNRLHPKSADQLISVPDGEDVDSMGNVVRRPNRLVNARTGMELPRGGGQQPAIKAGEVRDGYKFKGGNPADKANWEKA